MAHELRTPLANLLAVVEAEHGTLTQTNQPATASLNRVLANLLNNAIQHSPASGVVRVKLDEQGSKLRFAVRPRTRNCCQRTRTNL